MLTSLINHIPNLLARYAVLDRFHKTFYFRGFYLGALVLFSAFIIYGFTVGHYFLFAICLFIPALIVLGILIEFTSVQLGEQAIKISFPLWSKTIQLSQIRDIALEVIRDQNGKAGIFVLLNLHSGKTVRMCGVKEGTIALYASIRHRIKHLTS